jgi:hypothetical protein
VTPGKERERVPAVGQGSKGNMGVARLQRLYTALDSNSLLQCPSLVAKEFIPVQCIPALSIYYSHKADRQTSVLGARVATLKKFEL